MEIFLEYYLMPLAIVLSFAFLCWRICFEFDRWDKRIEAETDVLNCLARLEMKKAIESED